MRLAPTVLRRRAALLACVGVAALRPVPAQASVSLRALYDQNGGAPSDLAQRLEGQRIAVSGLVAPVPSGSADWLAIGETALVPCQLCGGGHDWPTGVLAVRSEGLPHLRDPYVAVTISGVLVLDPAAREGNGLPDRLVLRDAGLASA
jgi:hypothetical protein